MEGLLLTIAEKVSPQLGTRSEWERAAAALDLFGILHAVPMAVAGLLWLTVVTDLNLVRREWPTLLLLLCFLFLFNRLNFFYFIETPGARASRFGDTFEAILSWSAALIFGPTALWLVVLMNLAEYGRRWRQTSWAPERWDTFRNLAQSLAGTTLVSLIALTLYQRWGGVFPLPQLVPDAVLPACYATLVHRVLHFLIYAPMLLYLAAGWSPAFDQRTGWLTALGWGLVISMGAVTLVQLFAILAAGLYTQDGPGVYFTFLTGLLLVSWLAHRLSMYIERSQQRSRELARLEQLGRAILGAPPDASTLPALLAEHAANMFSNSHLEIHLFPDETLLHHPDDWPPVRGLAWEWLQANPEAHHFLPRTTLPWDRSQDHDAAVVLAPILDAKSRGRAHPACIGGIFLSRRLDAGDVTSLVPAVQSLAAQIASALHRAEVYRIESELAVAGQIQASFLPEGLPQIPGWQLAASLEPARETSGDFYDVIPLPNGRWGIVVADVADKGTGAALYMALSRTLIRTYAVEHDTQPALVFRAANRRILADARAYLFVTVFYGILDPATGMLAYCNAGHNPPYLLSASAGDAIQTLPRTGLPLGILEEGTWDQRTVQLLPGSALVAYSDGITEAQDAEGDFFGQERLLKLLQAHCGSSANALQDAVLATVHQFTGQTSLAPHDDITLVIVARDSTQDRPAANSAELAADVERPPSL